MLAIVNTTTVAETTPSQPESVTRLEGALKAADDILARAEHLTDLASVLTAIREALVVLDAA